MNCLQGLLNQISTVSFYAVQLFAFLILQLLLDGSSLSFNSGEYTCNDADDTALVFAKIMIFVSAAVFYVGGAVIFAGARRIGEIFRRSGGKGRAFIVALIVIAKHLVCLTLGIWDPGLVIV